MSFVSREALKCLVVVFWTRRSTMSWSTTSLEDKTKQAFIWQLLAEYYRNNPKRKLPTDNNGFHSCVLFLASIVQELQI